MPAESQVFISFNSRIDHSSTRKMSMGLWRCRIPRGVAPYKRISTSVSAASTRRPWARQSTGISFDQAKVCLSICRPRGSANRQGFATEKEPISIDDIRLQSEFEENKDIYEYLRKWQAAHPNILDPVRDPETDPSRPWQGSMLNDNQEFFEAGSDKLRATDEDYSDFAEAGGEGGSMGDFLQPGDLASFYS